LQRLLELLHKAAGGQQFLSLDIVVTALCVIWSQKTRLGIDLFHCVTITLNLDLYRQHAQTYYLKVNNTGST